MQTKAMRSASSEDIRSEARRAMRTREGKGRQRIRPSARRRYQRTMGAWCRWVRSSFGIFALGGQATETLVLP
jgi:hypothetical protein